MSTPAGWYPNPDDDRRRKAIRTLAVAGGAVAVVLATVALGVLLAEDSPEKADAGERATRSAQDLPTPSPRTLNQALKAGDADAPKATISGDKVIVRFKISDNLDNGLIREGIASDTFDIAEQVLDSGVPFQRLVIRGSFPMVDKDGNEERRKVYRIRFTSDTLEQMDFENVLATTFENLDDLAEGGQFFLHPSFRE